MTSLKRERSPAITYTKDLYNRTRSRSLETDMPGRSKLRRVVSTRAFSQYIDSSESVPSEHSSLYDAVLTSFESDTSRKHTEPDGFLEDPGLSNNRTIGVDGNDAAMVDSRPVYSRGKWPVMKLETIVEQRSASTLQASLAPSGADGYAPGNASLTAQRSPPNRIARRKSYGHKIYSFDDLDLPPPRPKLSSLPNGDPRLPSRSSSSGASFELRCLLNLTSPVEPTQPVYPPPVRSPTPPGLPSFGSPEAINYNAEQARRARLLNQQASLAGGGFQHPPTADDEEETSCCASGLRRLLGLPSCTTPRPPVLPAGTIARADDGTMVRGRFGARQSGHGIGAGPTARGLESHPFHRSSLPAARTKNTEDPSSTPPDTGQQNTRTGSNSSSQPGYLSPQTMPRAYTSLLRAYNGPHPIPQRRYYSSDGDATVPAASSVPLPSYIAHRRLEPHLPRSSEMVHNSGNNTGAHPPGPNGGGNDGSSAMQNPQPYNHLHPPIGSGPRNQSPNQPTNITQNKTSSLCEWLFMDCFLVCCECCGGDEPLQRQNQSSPDRRDIAMDGQSSTPLPASQTMPAIVDRQVRSVDNSESLGLRFERSPSTPWTPAWGWQPRCFGGDSTMDEEICTETAIELRSLVPAGGRNGTVAVLSGS
ncbi:hypothetical protein AJ79_09584 [Helicocarpus griseus UAMH5409]|uniref:Uncharacterized protein n=1 Tax=Helicocarpus griseus UAMH5409 TaxID=1447875 RepID=A0A2B7WIU6_9EURO|nr:hypothetical protein AJ79_09584 [Helicocarpus griseus UAMH5409]